jgi:hypothetical protein
MQFSFQGSSSAPWATSGAVANTTQKFRPALDALAYQQSPICAASASLAENAGAEDVGIVRFLVSKGIAPDSQGQLNLDQAAQAFLGKKSFQELTGAERFFLGTTVDRDHNRVVTRQELRQTLSEADRNAAGNGNGLAEEPELAQQRGDTYKQYLFESARAAGLGASELTQLEGRLRSNRFTFSEATPELAGYDLAQQNTTLNAGNIKAKYAALQLDRALSRVPRENLRAMGQAALQLFAQSGNMPALAAASLDGSQVVLQQDLVQPDGQTREGLRTFQAETRQTRVALSGDRVTSRRSQEVDQATLTLKDPTRYATYNKTVPMVETAIQRGRQALASPAAQAEQRRLEATLPELLQNPVGLQSALTPLYKTLQQAIDAPASVPFQVLDAEQAKRLVDSRTLAAYIPELNKVILNQPLFASSADTLAKQYPNDPDGYRRALGDKIRNVLSEEVFHAKQGALAQAPTLPENPVDRQAVLDYRTNLKHYNSGLLAEALVGDMHYYDGQVIEKHAKQVAQGIAPLPQQDGLAS